MNITTNQYYRGLNLRFDRRVERLIQVGFYRRHTEGTNIVSYMKGNRAISACMIMHAPKRDWEDELDNTLRHYRSYNRPLQNI